MRLAWLEFGCDAKVEGGTQYFGTLMFGRNQVASLT